MTLRRIVGLILAVLGMWMPISYAAAQNTDNFADAQALTVAVDPGAAAVAARQELARVGNGEHQAAARADALWVALQASFKLGDEVAFKRYLDELDNLQMPRRKAQQSAARIAWLRGLIARSEGDYGLALTQFRAAHNHFATSGDLRGQAQVLQNLAVLYNDVGNGSKALRYLYLARDLVQGDDLLQLNLENNFGVAYQALDNQRDALGHFETARGIAERLGIPYMVKLLNRNIALSNTALGRFSAAHAAAARLGAIDRIASPVDRLATQRVWAELYLTENRIADAGRVIDQIFAGKDVQDASGEHGHLHALAAEVYRRQGRMTEAMTHLTASRRADWADLERTASNRSALLSAQFEFSAQEARLQRLRAEQLQAEVESQRAMAYTLTISAAVAFLLLGALLFVVLRSRRRAEAFARQAQRLNDDLEKALRVKTDFLSTTSHEIRTPLNGVLGMTQIMLADRGLPDHIRPQIALVHDAGTTMKMLVDDILDVAKMEQGGFSIALRATEVVDVANRVVLLFSGQAEARGLALACAVEGGLDWQLCDPDRLTQILFNLVGNALKFTPKGRVDVTLSRAEIAGRDWLEIAVRDTGIGIGAQWHEHIFAMFHQVDGSRTRSYGGTGLGLAICRQLSRAMGGDVVLSSVEGEGSCFTVRLPWRPVAAPEQDGAVHATPPPARDHNDTTQNPDRLPASAPAREPVSEMVGEVAVIASNPMRLALLMAIVRSCRLRPFAVADGDAGRSLSARHELLWVIDGHVADAGARLGHVPAGAIIAVGDVDGGKFADIGNKSVIYCAFTRSALEMELTRWRDGAQPPCDVERMQNVGGQAKADASRLATPPHVIIEADVRVGGRR